MPSQKKPVMLRFSQHEYDFIQTEADRYNLSVTDFIRKRIFNITSDLDQYYEQKDDAHDNAI